MIAVIVVNHRSDGTDKLFDYLIPEELSDMAEVGRRVIVPFGRTNKPCEGFIMGISAHSEAKNLKSVISCEDIVFSEKTAELIKWMREKYISNYQDIIKTIVPSGISIKPEEWIVLCNSDANDEIAKTLSENGGAMETNSLLNCFENNIYAKIKKMCDLGIIKKEYREPDRIKDKKIRVAKIAAEQEEVPEILALLSKGRSPIQLKMFEILSVNERISLADLVQFSQGNYNAISALEKKGFIETFDIIVDRNHRKGEIEKEQILPELTEEQARVCEIISAAVQKESSKSFLLHGVTGSGKTEVYMRIIKECIDKGKSAVMLVPEISLTPQMVNRFLKRFGQEVAVLHSGLSLGERYDEWKKIRDGKVSVAIGARSAIFAPFENIGVIIVDEEHEGTYKSDMMPRYDTKEVAEFRACQNGAVLIMASATPSVCDYYRALDGKYELLEMKNRVNRKSMPSVTTVDMREELENGNRSVLSGKLLEELKRNLEKKEQSILFLNRRGYSTFVSCRNCGFAAKCPNCSISLTYHKYSDTLRCHYCGYSRKNYTLCPECGSKYIRFFGGGTQKVEEEIQKLIPGITTIRMDVDTTSRVNSHEKILEKFENEKIDVLVGTQMVTKGLDFDNVTLVGVISADVMLNIQDYRAEERAFDLIEQVTGRAGRAKKEGRAIIQTYTPENYAVTMAKKHDYISFYNYEIAVRRAMWYPPFCEMVSILFSSASENQVMSAARFFAKNIAQIKKLPQKVQILGPIPAAVAKINNKYRWRILIKCMDSDKLTGILADAKGICHKNANYKDVSIAIDKNPNNAY